ncbi:MAG: protein kinase domain-containing protein, partial [Gemmataceae bacterium]
MNTNPLQEPAGTLPFVVNKKDAAEMGDAAAMPSLTELRFDQRQRWQRGERYLVEEYLRLYPPLTEQPEAVVDLIAHEILLREANGEHPEPGEYRERFPQLETAVRRQFELLRSLPPLPPTQHPSARLSAWSVGPGWSNDGTLSLPAAMSWPVIPGYVVLEELGRGGMGVVYKAQQQRLNRIVALKMILSGAHASREELDRFRMEATAVAQIQHPNIVQIHEIGEHDGRPYFSMEFVDGANLSEQLADNPLPPRQAAELVETLARAIEVAHQRGIIHRDLKPGNILLTAGGMPKITDFGLAKRLDAQTGHTQTGDILGTPDYMAPEQAAGRIKELGPSTDVYALGAILYHCLTGRPPFQAASILEVLEQVRTLEPLPPGELLLRLPRDLETICLKCLKKEPLRRYASAEELADDLRRFLDGQPILARPTTSLERVVKWAKRRPALATLLVMMVLGLIIGVAAEVWFHTQLQEEYDKTQAAYQKALVEEQKTKDALTESHDRQVRLHIANGTRVMDQGDLLNSLAWFSKALELVEKYPEPRRQIHRLRLAAIWDQCPELRHILFHEIAVRYVAFNGQGNYLATASEDGTAVIWDVASGYPRTEPLRHDDIVTRVEFSPDAEGRYVVTASEDGTARVWETATGKPLRTLRHAGAVRTATFSQNGQYVVSAGGDGRAVIWASATGQAAREFDHDTPVRCAFLNPQGNLLVTVCDSDATVRVWDAVSGKIVSQFTEHRDEVHHAAFSPDGLLIVSTSEDGTAHLWDAQTGKSVGPPMKHQGGVRHAIFSADGRWVATASADHTARLWWATGAQAGHPAAAVMVHGSTVRHVAFGTDGERTLLATASEDNTMRLWDAQTGEALLPPLPHNGSMWMVAFSPRADLVAGASDDDTATIWTTKPRGQPRKLLHDQAIRAVAFSRDGTLLVTASSDGTAQVWNAAAQPLGEPLRHGHAIHHIAFSPRDDRLITASADGIARVW